mmetsp:Transcript_50022/g.126083  ORF Transcript_50022/g.126083 Transcript_50022/m.126083 type:complete len:478 (-) Transcript_50022:97-1530(-)
MARAVAHVIAIGHLLGQLTSLSATSADGANSSASTVSRTSLRGPRALSAVGCTASYTHNCMHNPVCCDPTTKCYAKDVAVAVCLHSCEPGIHENDPPQWQTPWTCNLVGGSPATAPAPPPASAPAPAPAPPTANAPAPVASCTASYTHNCMQNPVCCDQTATCYAKDDAVAVCLQSCEPGIHANDPPQWRTPWTCRKVALPPREVPTPAPPSEGSPRPAPTPAPTAAPPTTAPTPAPTPAPGLASPSSGEVLTFYMYRSQSDAEYELENVNAGNLEGTMWYLQNEVVSGAYGTTDKFGITRILRLKVQMRATQPLLDKGMHFGVRVAFDSGKCTGPGCEFDWSTYGYNVGCNNFGSYYPFPKDDTHYGGGIWYSLPGKCASMDYLSKDSQCNAQEPGGKCAGTPTGMGNCTWNYEPAGELRLEELYGSSSKEEFWANPSDDSANQRKVQAARDLFEAKYGKDSPVPECDFDKAKFFR